MSKLAHKLLDMFTKYSPESRRVFAANLLIVSLVGWVATHVWFWLTGITGAFEHVLNFISWWSIILTAWDVISTADVQVDE